MMKKAHLLSFIILLLGIDICLCASERNFDEVLAIAQRKLLSKIPSQSSMASTTTLFNMQQTLVTSIEVVDSSDAYYVFNTDSSFVIVSSDNRLPQILGYGFDGSFSPNNLSPALSFLLFLYDKKLQYLDSLEERETVLFGDGELSLYDSICPLISTKWGQETPFNNLAPIDDGGRSATGCVATAMAQVMNYYQYPKTGKGTHSYLWGDTTLFADFENTRYDYDNMLDEYVEGKYNDIQASAVATLMHHSGIAVDMDYSYEGSGTSLLNCLWGLYNYFDFDKNFQTLYWDSFSKDSLTKILYGELKQGHPVLVAGVDEDMAGHEFILDGIDANGYFHLNWGWDGEGNAYYDILSAYSSPYAGGYLFFQIGVQPRNDSSVRPFPLLYNDIQIKNNGRRLRVNRCAERDNAVDLIFIVTNDGMHDMNGTCSYILSDELGNENVLYRVMRNFESLETDTLSLRCNFDNVPDGVYKLYGRYSEEDYSFDIPSSSYGVDNYITLCITDTSICVLSNEKYSKLSPKDQISIPNQYEQNRQGGELIFSIQNDGALFQGEIQARIVHNRNTDDSIGVFGTKTLFIPRNKVVTDTIKGTFVSDIEDNTKYSLRLYYRTDSNDTWNPLYPYSYATVSFKIFAYTTLLYDTICQGENYNEYDFVIDKNSYTTTQNLYKRVIPLSDIKDSVVGLHLTVTAIHDTALYKNICPGSSFIIGNKEYTQEGDFVDTLLAVNGCDSIIRLYLSVASVYDTSIYDTLCYGDSIIVNGHIYTKKGTIIDTLPTVDGCDSIIKRFISIRDNDTNLIEHVINLTTTQFPYNVDENLVLPSMTDKDTTLYIRIDNTCVINKYHIKVTGERTPVKNTESHPIRLEIADCFGRVIQGYSKQIPPMSEISLPCGVYVFRYFYSDGTTKIKKEILCKQ